MGHPTVTTLTPAHPQAIKEVRGSNRVVDQDS